MTGPEESVNGNGVKTAQRTWAVAVEVLKWLRQGRTWGLGAKHREWDLSTSPLGIWSIQRGSRVNVNNSKPFSMILNMLEIWEFEAWVRAQERIPKGQVPG